MSTIRATVQLAFLTSVPAAVHAYLVNFTYYQRLVGVLLVMSSRYMHHIFDHLQSSVVYNFDYVCLSVCQMITFESLDVGSLYLHIQYICREY